MGRAERRRQERESIKAKTKTYNLTKEQLESAVDSYVCSKVGDTILKGVRMAAKFEVVTSHPEELAAELMEKLKHGCTVVPAKGMYTNTDRSLLICVVNRRQVIDFERIVKKYEDTFTFVSTVNGTVGTFHRAK